MFFQMSVKIISFNNRSHRLSNETQVNEYNFIFIYCLKKELVSEIIKYDNEIMADDVIGFKTVF